jgi:hypothetical protein
MAAGILYITSIKREVHSHGERLQGAHQNELARGQDILKRLEKMEAHIEKLGESQSPSFTSDLPGREIPVALSKYCTWTAICHCCSW